MKQLKELSKEDRHIITDPKDMLMFLQGGIAECSIYSCKTENEFKYYIKKVKEHNNALYVYSNGKYLGSIGRVGNITPLYKTRKSAPIGIEFEAFSWFIKTMLTNSEKLSQMKFIHHGKCCVCGAKLITKKSVLAGIGPICRKTIGQIMLVMKYNK